MNKEKALEVLGIEECDEETIKKSYRLLALRYHPDKNSNEDATAKFQEIHEAYVYLNGKSNDGYSTDYKSLLRAFLKTWIAGDSESDNDVLHEWLRRITTICEDKAISLLNNIDKHILKTIYELLLKNTEILHISKHFIEKMHDVLKTKFEKDERIILHPFLEDIENVYKLTVGEKVYLVPLWHHHLLYDGADGKEIYVDCYPLLPEFVWIDEYNNINIKVEKDLVDIWTENGFTVEIGRQKITIDKSQLRLISYQQITCIGKGISLPTNPICFTPFHVEDAKSNRSNPFTSAQKGGILNENLCKDKSNVYIHLTIFHTATL